MIISQDDYVINTDHITHIQSYTTSLQIRIFFVGGSDLVLTFPDALKMDAFLGNYVQGKNIF